jgi:hypothetical protein
MLHVSTKGILVRHTSSLLNIMGFWTFLGQTKFLFLTSFHCVNQEGMDNILVKVAYYNCPAEDAHKGFTYMMLIVSV